MSGDRSPNSVIEPEHGPHTQGTSFHFFDAIRKRDRFQPEIENLLASQRRSRRVMRALC